MKERFIAIEGNIGAGKTTLATELAKHYNAQLLLETFSDNPFLSTFYQSSDRYALPLELHFLLDRYEQLKTLDFGKKTVISDYVLGKSHLFAGVTLNADEMNLFNRIYQNLQPRIQKPDLLIYLHASINTLKKNIEKRGRPFEKNISSDYLEKIQNAYQPFLKQHPKVLMLEMNDVDFENNMHLQQLIEFLEKDYEYENYILKIE